MAAIDPASLAAGAGPSQTPVPPAQASLRTGHTDTILHAVQDLLRDLPGLVSDRVHLLSLELRRAGLALAQIVALVVAAAILGVTAWLALWIAIAGALVAMGVHWGLIALGVLIVNLAAMAYAVMRARSLAHLLTLPATVRRLTATPASPAPSASGGAGDEIEREPDRP